MKNFKVGDTVIVTRPDTFSLNFFRVGAKGKIVEIHDSENLKVDFFEGDYGTGVGGSIWYCGEHELELAP